MRYDPDGADQCDERGKTRARCDVIPGFHVVALWRNILWVPGARDQRESLGTTYGLTRHLANVMVFAFAATVLGRACPRIRGYLLTVFLTMANATPAGCPVNYCPTVPEVRLSRGQICGIYCPQPRMIRNCGSLQRDASNLGCRKLFSGLMPRP